jgi:hypothetical protein
MRPVRNVFQKLSRTEQRSEGVVAYLCPYPSSLRLKKFENNSAADPDPG